MFGHGVRSFINLFLLSYNRGYLTYFDQTWNTERGKYGEGSRLYYIELSPPGKFVINFYSFTPQIRATRYSG